MQPFPELCVPQCVCAKMFVLFLNLPLLNFEEEPKCYIYVNVRQIPPGFFYILPQFCSRSIAINASGGHRRGRGQEGRGSRTRGGQETITQRTNAPSVQVCRHAATRGARRDRLLQNRFHVNTESSMEWNAATTMMRRNTQEY